MQSRIPPFKSIEAFAAAARSLSLTKAASILNLTVPAVSRRIQALEVELGVPLFQRSSRSIALTNAGRTYFFELAPAIETIQEASERVRARPGIQSVKVRLPASLAANWLIPRLHRFRAKHQSIQIDLESTNGRADIEDGDADIAIWFGTGNWPGVRAKRLLDVKASPVCSAGFLAANAEVKSSDGLLRAPLLGITHQQDLWVEWLRDAGVRRTERISHAFDNFHLLYRAAACGLGVALGIDVIVQPYLDAAQLVLPFDRWRQLSKHYYIVSHHIDWARRPVHTFREWLLLEAGRGA
jgi:LysR family glycine cleavage system transcriptional activator